MRGVAGSLARRARWRVIEVAFWLVAFAALVVPSGRHLILNEITILALFALSLDLILGYGGIVSPAIRWRASPLPSWRRRHWVSSPASWCCAAVTSRA